MPEFQNPTPVVVGLIPVAYNGHRGLLTIRRDIEPGRGKLALPGGYLEMERWQEGLAREVFEETGITIGPDQWTPFSFASSYPNPNRLLVFAISHVQEMASIPVFRRNPEVQEIGVVFREDHLDVEMAFPLHLLQIRRYLNEQYYSNEAAPTGFLKLHQEAD